MTDETKLTPMQKVDELIERGKSKGGLTYKEVIDTLGNDALDVDQMEVVYDRFEDADINVVEEIDPAEIAGEDVTEIVLNIKGISAKLHSDGPVIANIRAKGPCVVTAGDILGHSDLEIVNVDHVIATLAEGASLNIEMVFAKGIGYVCSKDNKYDDMPIDTIAVENEVADNMYQRSELDYLIYNDPIAYADLILNGNLEAYLKAVTEYKMLD